MTAFLIALSPVIATTSVATPPSPLFQYAPLLFIGVIFYFLLIRPQQKQRKEHETLIKSLKTGDKIVTTSGFHGMIANIKEKTFIVKFADNVKFEVDKAAVVGFDRAPSGEASSETKAA